MSPGFVVDRYSTCEPSALNRGRNMLCPSTRTSAVVLPIFCLKSFQVPLRFETNSTALLSAVHASAMLCSYPA